MVCKVLKPKKIADNFEDFPLKEQTSHFHPKDKYILIFFKDYCSSVIFIYV